MMKFILKIFLVFVIAAITLTLFNKIYIKGHARYYQHETQRMEMLTGSTAYYDVLFIGSSRAHVHYDPKVIDSITHLSSYNFGVEGGNLLETNLWLQVYLQKHPKPKLVILDLVEFAFDIEKRPFFNHTIYFPYLKNDIIFRTVTKYKKIGYVKYLPFLELMEVDDYNKFNALKGLSGRKEEASNGFTYNGYAENGTATLKPSTKIIRDTNNYSITETGKKLLSDIIYTCKNNNIRLVLTYSPEYDYPEQKSKAGFFEFVNTIARNDHLPFFDYRNLPICKDSTLFANPGHLNKFGAKLFSVYVADMILHEIEPNEALR